MRGEGLSEGESERCGGPLKKLALRRLVWAMADVSIKAAARTMHLEGVSSVVVVEGDKPIGILTDSDLREVIAEGADVGMSVGEYLKAKPGRVSGLVAVEISEGIHEALSKMLEHRIKHTVVTEGGKVRGVVTIGDLAYRLGPFHLYYVIRLRRARSLGEVREIITEFKDEIIRNALIDHKRGGMIGSTALFESVSHVMDASLMALANIKGRLPSNAVYAASGSWGRKEQFVLTDRDTLVVYDDGSGAKVSELRPWVEGLEDCMDEVGFAPCQHGYTARKLLFGREELTSLIERWGNDPQRFAVELSIIADSRAVLGDEGILEGVKRVLTKKLHKNRLFVTQSLMYRPPFSHLGIPKSFDFKSKVAAPLEYSVRGLAVTNGITVAPTSERIDQLGKAKVISQELRRELLQSHEIIMGLKITSQLLTQGTVEASALTPLEVGMVKQAMKSVKLFQHHIERTFV